MCVIINRQPNVTIEYEKIQSACKVNPDGFGFAFVEDKSIIIIKEFDPKGNDPEKVARLLEDYKDYAVSLHLRFSTVGEKNADNCHPYVTCMKDHDGVDVVFMHNGTLSDFKYKDSRMSDSYHFNEEVVRPLFQRIAAFDTPESALNDPLFKTILTKYAGASSVFNILDSEGNILVINEDKGVKKDGWWASNDYSFNRYHREPAKTESKGGWYYNGSYYSRELTYPEPDDEPITKDTTVKHLPTNVVKQVPDVVPPKLRETFVEVAKISSLDEVCKLNDEDIEELIEVYPDYAKLLIQDLILALYQKESDNVTVSDRAAANG
jgi:predicted glutamine amidotransferase